MNLPNKLSLLRICMIPLFVTAYFLPYKWSPFVAIAIFILAAFTDFLDGFIARKYHLVTDLGKLLDPIADKILVATALFCVVATNPLQWLMLYSANPMGQFHWDTFGTIFLAVCASLILARELLIDAVRMIAASKGVVVQANIFGKIKTVLQDITLPLLVLTMTNKYEAQHFLVAYDHFPEEGNTQFVLSIVAVAFLTLATVMTVVSGVIYLVQNKHVFATVDPNAPPVVEGVSVGNVFDNDPADEPTPNTTTTDLQK